MSIDGQLFLGNICGVKMQEIRTSNFGKFSDDYAKHRAGFPDSFFLHLSHDVELQPSMQLLDLGVGTGTLARWFAKQSIKVTGLDFDKKMIEASKGLDSLDGVNIKYVLADANRSELPSQSFDLITAGQCWHWFDAQSIASEVKRMLKPEGKLVVAYFDWISRKDNPVDLMYKLKQKFVEDAVDRQRKWPLGFYPQKPDDLDLAGFSICKSSVWEEDIPYSHESWLGRLRAYSGLGGRLDDQTLGAFELEYRELIKVAFPQEVLMIPHKVWYRVLTRS